ncbi:hypothetical protein [Caudoviricetes sp.]|nr:hypothetical protein [Caudoviricetes sp.]
MRIFKRKKTLEKRIESLENYLGLFYHVDTDGYNEHKQDGDDKWTKLGKLEERIKALEEKKGKK